MEGWISIYRQIVDSWIWKNNEPFDKRSAWIDLLMMVNHKNKTIPFEKGYIEIERGQILTSIKKLSERWKWSRHKVSDFLNKLEQDTMIVQVRDTKKILISIVNYDKFQHIIIKKDMSQDIFKGQVEDTNNNDNNIYYILLNKYKSEMQEKNFGNRIVLMGKIKNTKEYQSLSEEEKRELYTELIKKG